MFFAQFFVNDPLALKIEKPLGSWPAPRATKLLLVMKWRPKGISSSMLLGRDTVKQMCLCREVTELDVGVRSSMVWSTAMHGIEGWAAQGSPVLMRFLKLVMLVGTTSPMVKTYWETGHKDFCALNTSLLTADFYEHTPLGISSGLRLVSAKSSCVNWSVSHSDMQQFKDIRILFIFSGREKSTEKNQDYFYSVTE